MNATGPITAAADEFAELAKREGVDTLVPVPLPQAEVQCDACGCLFIPMFDGEHVWPDRYAYQGYEAVGCTVKCKCHDLAYPIDVVER